MHFIFPLPQKAIGTHWLCILDINHLCKGNTETNSREKTKRNRRKQNRSSQLSTHPSPIFYACPVQCHMIGESNCRSFIGQIWGKSDMFPGHYMHDMVTSTYQIQIDPKVTTNKACTLMGTTGILLIRNFLLHEPPVHQHGRVTALCKTYVEYTSNAQLIHCLTLS